MNKGRHIPLKQQSVFVILFMMLMCCSGSTSADIQPENAMILPLAPGFELQDMQGVSHQLKSYEGKTVIVNFWAVWCAPCRKEIPAMNQALAILKDENIAMLGINVGDSQKAIEDFSEDYPMDFTVLMDKSGLVSQHWQVTGFPTTYIVNQHGQIVSRFVGGREWDKEKMLYSLRSVAAN